MVYGVPLTSCCFAGADILWVALPKCWFSSFRITPASLTAAFSLTNALLYSTEDGSINLILSGRASTSMKDGVCQFQ